ncbi:MAG: histidinol dehydrogenase [Chitinophagaceae bacterium]
MQVIQQPDRSTWANLVQRPTASFQQLEKPVRKVMAAVKLRGDAAVKKYTREFDGVTLRKLEVTEKEINQAVKGLDAELKASIQLAASNIRSFHEAQHQAGESIETMPGVRCWRKAVGIEKVGLYIPGGSAPLFSTLLMLAIPATIAGCNEIILCTPPQKDGTVHPAILFAAHMAGVKRIFKVGGVQAIAAMAYGTESVPQVYKIFGPGNQYVTVAKQLAQQEGVAIDMPAGPSEVCVLADDTAVPAFIAADLLSQAEHGPDSQVFFVTTSKTLVPKVQQALQEQLALLPRKALAEQSLSNSRAIVLSDMKDAMEMVNAYAPEHLILCCAEAEALAEQVVNAGSVFIGNYSPESVGDYASGTNHTLPTNGFARAYSGVSVDSFVKKITFQQLTREGLMGIGKAVMTMAEAEGLSGHARAVSVRIRN